MRSCLVGAARLAPALLAAACGDDEDDDATSSNEPASEQTDESATEEAGPRTVEHAMGSTEVPAEPERVVVLDSSFLDASLALGVTPVAANEAIAGSGMPAYLGDAVAEMEVVGLIEEPKLEDIAAQRPDLILGEKVSHEANYGETSGLAPTV